MTTPAPIKVLCGWCGATIHAGTLPASHRICPNCETKYFPKESTTMNDAEVIAKIVAIITDADAKNDNDHISRDEATTRDLESFDAIVEVLAAERKIRAMDNGSWN